MLYMGGKAPSDDNVVSWIATVQEHLAPTSYVLSPITELFSLVSTVDESSAISKFEAGLVTYCKSKGCRRGIPDKNVPNAATVNFSTGPFYGGNGGG